MVWPTSSSCSASPATSDSSEASRGQTLSSSPFAAELLSPELLSPALLSPTPLMDEGAMWVTAVAAETLGPREMSTSEGGRCVPDMRRPAYPPCGVRSRDEHVQDAMIRRRSAGRAHSPVYLRRLS